MTDFRGRTDGRSPGATGGGSAVADAGGCGCDGGPGGGGSGAADAGGIGGGV